MKKQVFIRLVILLQVMVVFQIQYLFAQTTIKGMTLSSTGDTLAGVNIYIQGTLDGGTSHHNGAFAFVTESNGNQLLIASMIGMETFSKPIQLNDSIIYLKITLTEIINELNAVTISAGNFETGDVKKASVLTSLDIATTAGATADIYGALKTLPGTLPAMEQDGLLVRGGDTHEMKTFFDGILVNHPFAADIPDIAQRGRFSPFLFKGTSFTTGAYSALLGNALSGTMSMESKDLPVKTKSDVGIMTVGFDANHAQRFKNSSLEVSGAYYNLAPIFNLVEQNTQWTKEPEAFNASAFYKSKTGENGMFKLYTTYEQSYTGMVDANYADITKISDYKIKSKNLYINSTWSQFLNNNWKFKFGIGYGNDDSNIKIDDNKFKENDKSLHSLAGITRYLGNMSDIKASIEYFYFDHHDSYNAFSTELTSPEIAISLESNYYFTKKLALRTGIRFEHTTYNNENNIAPRISLAYQLNSLSQVSLGYGIYYQQPQVEFLKISKQLDFEKATHMVLNYQYQKNERTFRAEAYYKLYENLVKETTETASLLNNEGNGYSRGLDLFWRDTKSIRRADYWITYSFLDTERNYRDFPNTAIPTFAANHVVNVVAKYFITGWNISTGITYTYASGRTYYNPNNPDFLSDHTKDYHNFSANLSYLTSIGGKFTILYFSVENIFGIDNVFGYRYTPDGSVRKPVVPSAPRNIFAGMFITFGDDNFR